MKPRNLLCIVCALSGCTLSISRNPGDEFTDVEDAPYVSHAPPAPETRAWDPIVPAAPSERPPRVTSPTFVPVDPDPPTEHSDDLRDLSIHMSGMDEELHRFMKVRVVSKDNESVAVGVIHQGIPTPEYRFDLPNSLLKGAAYTLTLYADADGSGGYSAPPSDHAWSIPIPASNDDVVMEFEHNTGYVDIERDAPLAGGSLVLTLHAMQEYYRLPLDVRIIERQTGRLLGRQLREVPGDTFDLTIGGVLESGVDYVVDVAVDIDEDGYYDPIIDDSWRVAGTASRKGLSLDFNPDGKYVDVGF